MIGAQVNRWSSMYMFAHADSKPFSEPYIIWSMKEKTGQAGDVAADKAKDVKGAAKDAAGTAQVKY